MSLGIPTLFEGKFLDEKIDRNREDEGNLPVNVFPMRSKTL
jgi:hypothetical protein